MFFDRSVVKQLVVYPYHAIWNITQQTTPNPKPLIDKTWLNLSRITLSQKQKQSKSTVNNYDKIYIAFFK